MNEFAPEKILDVLSEHAVDFVVIGGFAAVLHGASRPTRDVDVTPERSEPNLTRLATALTALDARIRVEGIDGGLPSGTHGYDDLVRGAQRLSVGESRPQIASLGDIIRSKESASRPKDAEALPELRRLAIAISKANET